MAYTFERGYIGIIPSITAQALYSCRGDESLPSRVNGERDLVFEVKLATLSPICEAYGHNSFPGLTAHSIKLCKGQLLTLSPSSLTGRIRYSSAKHS
jgi:hypothetical protein